MSEKRAIAKNYLFQLSGKAYSVFAGFVMIAIIARALGDFGLGEFTTAMVYLQIVTVLIDLGLSLMFIQLISRPGADESRIASALLSLRLLSAGALLAIATALAFLTPYSMVIKLTIAAGTLSYISLSSSGMLTGLFQKNLSMHRAVIAEVVNRTLAMGLVILAVALNYGPPAIILAIGIGNALQVILMIILARKHTMLRPRIDLQIWKSALAESWPIGVGIFFNLIYLKSDVLILGWFHPQSEVGIYGGAYRLIDVFTTLPTMFMGLMLPKLALSWGKKAAADFRTYLQQTFDLFALIALPLVFGTVAVAVPLSEWILGSDFTRSGHVLPVLMLVMPAVFFGAMSGHAIVAMNKQRRVLWAYALTAVVAIGGYMWLIPQFGMWGAAWMTVVSEYLINGIIAVIVFKSAKFFPAMRTFFTSLLASALMLFALTQLPDYFVLIDVGIGMVIYTVLIVAFGGIKLSTLRAIAKKQDV